ncbi:Glutathione-regulated potassium-efflux system ancillary protein KefG [Sandaracinus amylolyticus]|uniref:Glutathione-regulated potassium-efflux system ancillary protein KefG n=1 Tax=Sandaracinus amylolyticus TaxID=927083 RepID=A0A0F6VYJ8_9BACT|nr:Glutathione-regulated potassium-efflux system ancillary protein KefG [Sandaracinus amylolyticus]
MNRRLFEAAQGVEGVTTHDLYESYPSFAIDVQREQALLVEHDVIVLQHPFYWYSAPSIVKEWLDVVLEHGWAYGVGGTALRGKTLMNATTTGGAQAAYHPEGRNRFTMRHLLSPFDQSAYLCGMRYLAPFVVHGALALSQHHEVAPHAQRYARLLAMLRDDRLDLERAARADIVNALIDDAHEHETEAAR